MKAFKGNLIIQTMFMKGKYQGRMWIILQIGMCCPGWKR